MKYGTVFGSIDLFAREHGGAMLFQGRLCRQLEQCLPGFIANEVL